MQLTSLLTVCVAALASTAAAMPRIAGPYHGVRVPVHVPHNATSSAHNATTTSTRGKKPLSTGLSHSKNSTGSHGSHSSNVANEVSHCHELCSLEAQTCTIAVPEEDAFW
ncbi:hypothetical protein NUU61_006464 [Penicillium alfredii]|uniref:Uncharacterized protein n=1 Tax=Penicillium alfredii TaxID=1506179 RepID=A0A9W9F0Y9_9EURO|nr:uncharacterized protein NUU61_006464 [Penicillium alfredii]KAJ5091594.1 hypothetical protein NUU61_006464 [Penicillium alfredii]